MHSCAHVHFGVFGATFVRLLGDACVTVVSTARSLVSWGEGENGVSSPGPLMNLFMVAPRLFQTMGVKVKSYTNRADITPGRIV